MRIWLQSASSVGHDPSDKPYEESLKRGAQKVVRPDTVVDIKGVRAPTFNLPGFYYWENLVANQIVENGLQAEKEGYDAFAINCSLEPGYYELRQLLNIPVFSVAESVLHLACLLGDKFACIGHVRSYAMEVDQLIKKYGLKEKSAGTFYLSKEGDGANIVEALKQPKTSAAVKAFIKEAEKAVDCGAEVIIPLEGVVNRLVSDAGITQVKGAPVLPVLETFVKFVEMMVDLQQKVGVSVSRVQLFAQPGKKLLTEVRKAYGLGD
jgi:allantoin racemase